MERIENKLDDVSDSLHKSKWLFRGTLYNRLDCLLRKGIKSTFGIIKNIFTSPKKTKREKEKNSNKSKQTDEQNFSEKGRQELSENTKNNIKETKR